jgi:transmembrane sensor
MMAMEDIERERTRTKAWLPALAASVAICAVGIAGWFGYRYATASTDYVTTAGATRDVTLPDGSVAHLNSRTDLRWVGRSGERRVVLLEGEAFFEVTHDPSRPFSVILDHSQIRVVGTRFNVRRRENQEVVVTVLEGTVQVLPESVSGSAQPVWMRTLHANEQLVYNNTGLIRDVYSADRANAAKWRQGILEFEDEPLSNIVEDLGRYTDRHIVVRDPRLAQLHLGGQLNVHNDVKASLGLLGKLAPLEVHESGNTFVLNYRQEPTKERP